MKKTSFNLSKTIQLKATTEVITLPVSKTGDLNMIQILAGTDETTAPTRLDHGYVRGAKFVSYQSTLAPAIGFTVPFTGNMFLLVDEKPAIRIIGGVVGDNITISVGGYSLSMNESGD